MKLRTASFVFLVVTAWTPLSATASRMATPNESGEASLLASGRRAASFQERDVVWGISWLSDEEILYIRQSEPLGNTFFKRNVRTGKTTPLPALTKLDPMTTPGYGYRVSPDGKWFLWQNGSGEFEWANLDGRQHSKRKGFGFGLNEYLWMQDSRHWVELGGEGGFTYERILIHDALNPARAVEVKVSTDSPLDRTANSPANSVTPLAIKEATFTLKGLLRVRRMGQPSREGDSIATYDMDLKNKCLPSRESIVYAGVGVGVIEAVFSPRTDEIAWLLARNGLHLCVSRLDGNAFREIGSLQVGPQQPGDSDSKLKRAPYCIRWRPDGNALSFLYDNALWVAPVPTADSKSAASPQVLLGPSRAVVRSPSDESEMRLEEAVSKGNAAEAKALIAGGAVSDWHGDLGKGLLMTAVRKNDEAMVRLLLDSGADLNTRGEYGDTPLIHAVEENNDQVALLIIGRGARTNVRGSFGRTALLVAVENQSLTMVSALLERGADPNVAAEEGNIPLVEAARRDSIPILQMLLAKGARVDRRDGWNVTALWHAAVHGHTEMCKLLLDLHADPNVQANPTKTNGETALMAAAQKGNLELCRLLVERGARVNARDPAGYSPLSNAVDYGYIELARYLLDKGADPNISLIDSTILISAVLKNRSEIVKLLLECGARVNALGAYYGSGDPTKKTPLAWARHAHFDDIAKILRRAGGHE